jgi:vancomycin resistance protein YoaR
MIPKVIKTHIYKVRKHLNTPVIIGLSLILVLLITSAVVGVALYRQDEQYRNVIYPNVSINGVDVSGKTKEQVIELFQKDTSEYNKVTFNILYKETQIATISGEELNMKTNIHDIATQAYSIARTEHGPTRLKQKLELLFNTGSYAFETTVQYNTKPFDEFIRITADTYYKKPKNAKFVFENNRLSSFEADEPGLEINKKQFQSDLERALKEIENKPTNKTIIVKDQVLKPEITLAETNQLGIEELIGEGVSDYSGSSPDRIYNLTLAASKFNGVIIPPNEEFSFNTIIGDISSNSGYRPSYIIKNGQTVLGDGGGVCQVSTTAFRAALNTGLPITERHAHAYRVSYYENDAKPGFDATIYTPSVDLRFKNDTPSNILIQTQIDEENNKLYFRLYGKKDNRVVELSDATVWDVVPPPEPRYQDDPTLPEGQTKQVDYAAWGAKSKFTYKVTKDNKVLHEEEFYSSYRPWQAVFLVGKKP